VIWLEEDSMYSIPGIGPGGIPPKVVAIVMMNKYGLEVRENDEARSAASM
jgi:hypothetical protein